MLKLYTARGCQTGFRQKWGKKNNQSQCPMDHELKKRRDMISCWNYNTDWLNVATKGSCVFTGLPAVLLVNVVLFAGAAQTESDIEEVRDKLQKL